MGPSNHPVSQYAELIHKKCRRNGIDAVLTPDLAVRIDQGNERVVSLLHEPARDVGGFDVYGQDHEVETSLRQMRLIQVRQ